MTASKNTSALKNKQEKAMAEITAVLSGKAPTKAPAKSGAKAKGTAAVKKNTAPKEAPATPAKTETKPEAKPEVKAATKAVAAFVARSVKPGTPVFVIAEQSRPSLGRSLFAHTHAALHLLGLMDPARPAVKASAVLTVMGQRAVSYHRKERNFEDGPDHTIRLSVAGRNKFLARAIDGELANAFLDLFIGGKADAKTGVPQAKVFQTQLAS